MKLTESFKLFKENKITLEEAAAKMNLTPKDLKFRITVNGDKLPTLLKTLERIQENEITRGEASQLLNVSPRQINQLMKTWKVERPLSEYLVTKEQAALKWMMRKRWAIEFVAGTVKIEDAAQEADVSERQIRRWVSELLDKHMGMVFKDLNTLSTKKRFRIANEIETAEGIEYAEQQMLKAISNGDATLNQLATEKAQANRRRRKENV